MNFFTYSCYVKTIPTSFKKFFPYAQIDLFSLRRMIIMILPQVKAAIRNFQNFSTLDKSSININILIWLLHVFFPPLFCVCVFVLFFKAIERNRYFSYCFSFLNTAVCRMHGYEVMHLIVIM